MNQADCNGAGGGAPRRRRPKVERPGKACECGNAKAVGAYACDRCRRLESSGFMADTRPRSVLVGVREEPEVLGLVAIGQACDRFLRDRGLIDPDRWRASNGYAPRGGVSSTAVSVREGGGAK